MRASCMAALFATSLKASTIFYYSTYVLEWTHCLFISLKHTSAVPSLVVAVAVTPSSSAQGQSSRDIAEVDVTVPTFDVDDEDVPEVRFVGGKYSHLGQMMSYLLYLQ